MEKMSREEYIAMFGLEAGEAMFEQQERASAGSGQREPFPLLKKVNDSDLGIGKFGTFVFGVQFASETNADGEKVVENPGTNIGSEFDFIPLQVAYRLKRHVEGVNGQKGKTFLSNIFLSPAGFSTAVDAQGNKIPADKEARKALDWKAIKIIGGLVKVNDTWTPIIWEVDGALYFSTNELFNKGGNKGVTDGIYSIKTKIEKNGNVKYPVVDVEKSTINASGLLDVLKANRDVTADLAIKMNKYFKDNDYSNRGNTSTSGSTQNTGTAETDAGTEGTGNW